MMTRPKKPQIQALKKYKLCDCPPPNEFDNAEREAWDETVALIKHCRRTGIKVPIKIPSDLAGKWSKEQKAVWMLAKAGVTKAEKRVEAAQRRAKARATT